MDAVTAIILAAGEGKRMRSRQPKILHRLCGRPLVGYPLRLARTFADRVVMVVPQSAEDGAQVAGEGVLTVVQRERLGTRHAGVRGKDACGAGTILGLPGDMPLLTVETIERLLNHHKAASAAATLLTAIVDNPAGYGRVLRQRGRVARNVEDRDATDDQKKINEIGTSVYCFDARQLWSALTEVRPDNDQGEYYLTDVVAILSRAGATVEAGTAADPAEAQGVNDRKQLAAIAVVQSRRILDWLMESGVTIVDPASTYVEDTVTIGPDTVVQPQTVIEGATVIGSECVIGAGSHVSGSRLADRVVLKPYSIIEEARSEEHTSELQSPYD